MNSDVYSKIIREYDIKRQRKINEANAIIKELYSNNNGLEELERKKNMLALKITRNIINSDDLTKQVEVENMQRKLSEIEKKIDNIFKKNGIEAKNLIPKFECTICNDTGKVTKDGIIDYCSCFKQRIINQTYSQYNMSRISDENFNTFDTCYYSSKVDKEKYGLDKSPLQNIQTIKSICQKFIDNIQSDDQKNLLFVGNTGLGKTFLSNCIANELIKKGKTVIYQTSPLLMDQIIQYKFKYNKSEEDIKRYNEIYDVDLLIIDDLGTESINSNKFTELFNIINTRLIRKKKILISTNLGLKELYDFYDERVVSRILGNFIACKFIGEDIRIKKKKLN